MAKPIASNCNICRWDKGGMCLYWYDGIPGRGMRTTDVASKLGRGYVCPDPLKKK